jgi:hypothetical protein
MKANVRGALAFFVLSATWLACGGRTDDGRSAAKQESAAVTTPTTLNTFINHSLEIDQQFAGTLNPNDANLFVGLDPADNTASYQVPTGGPATFIDWNDLTADKANHVLYDFFSGKDPTSFPQSNACVGPSQVLSKMDLTYVASANNTKYAYFGVQRSGDNGDAGYYWVFTKLAPRELAGVCNGTAVQLVYDISVGDVLLAGHFHPNGSPLLRVFTSNAAQTGVDAVSAIDFTNARWVENAADVAAVAINETITAPGGLGSAGVVALTGSNLGTEVFAEAAVDLSLFTGGASTCGATFYGSVITRSSGSGGTSPDLKDLAGPALFNFGSVKAVPTAAGTCADSATYSATATGPDGTALQNPTCNWTFTGNGTTTTATGCSNGSISLPAGTYTASVTVSDPVSGCSDTESVAPFTVYDPLGVHIAPTAAAPTCPGMTSTSVTYTATVTGGTGGVSYTWNGETCSGASCTIAPADSLYCDSESFSVTVHDTAQLCPDATSETETYTKTTTVTASNN